MLIAILTPPAAGAGEPAVSSPSDRVVSAAIASFQHGEMPREPRLRGLVIGVWPVADEAPVDDANLMSGTDFSLLVAQHLYHIVHAAKGTVVVCPAESPSFVSPPGVFREKRCDLVIAIRVTTRGVASSPPAAEQVHSLSAALAAAVGGDAIPGGLPEPLGLDAPTATFPATPQSGSGGRAAIRRSAREEASRIGRGLSEFAAAHGSALHPTAETSAAGDQAGGDVPSYPRVTGSSRQAFLARQLAGDQPLAADRVDWFVKMFARVAPNDRTLVAFQPNVERDGESWILRGTTNVPSLIKGIEGALEAVGVTPVRNEIRSLPRRDVLKDRLFGACRVSTALVYDKPAATGGVVTQLLYGEPVFLLDARDGWLQLHAGDGYVGWVREESIAPMDAGVFDRYRACDRGVLVTEVSGDTDAGTPDLPRGARVAVVDLGDDRCTILTPEGSKRAIRREAVRLLAADPAAEARALAALELLHTPYRWGGRSPLGLDCSGLITNVGGQTGDNPPRDAWQQALVGELVATDWHRTGIRRGDLLYFIDATGRVYHTGIALSATHFVHAAVPEVQIGSFDKADRLYDERLDTSFFVAKRP